MNKWSLLLFSVLGLLLSTTSELNFVDGRLGCCDRSSRPLLSDTRLSIYEPHSASQTFTEKKQLISPQRDIPYTSRNVELKLPSGLDGRREQLVGRQISSDVFNPEDSTLSNARDRKALREINDVQLRRNLKFSRDNYRENHVDRSRSRNNDFFGNKMERNSRERGVKTEEKLSDIWDDRFRHNDGLVSSNLKDHKQERFNRRTFVIRTNIMPNPRNNIDEIRLRFKKKNEGKKEIERRNHDIITRQRLFMDTRLTSDLSQNKDRKFIKDERITQLASKMYIPRNINIRDYRCLSVREYSIGKMYEREFVTDLRCNTDMSGTVDVYGRSYDNYSSEEMLERINSKNMVILIQNKRFTRLDQSSSRLRTIQRENEGPRNRIREDERQMNNGFETRLFQKRYSTRRLQKQTTNINRLQEIRQARFYNDIIVEDERTDYSNVFIERTEPASDQSRNINIRENAREIRISEEHMAERITPRNIDCLVEKRAVNSKINKRRSQAFRRSVLERRERDSSRYGLDHENENNFDQRRIRQIRNSHNEDKLREARNTQQIIRKNAMGQDINNIRQISDDDNVFQRFLVRDDNNKKLVSRLERENLSSPGKRASQIRMDQRDNQNKINIRAMTRQENRIQTDPNFKQRLVSNANTNIEKRRVGTYDEKSDREEFRNSLVREAERAFDESRIRQVRDKHEYRREYRANVERTVGRVLSRIDRNRNNVVESGFVRFIASMGKNLIYGTIRNGVTLLRRRENYEKLNAERVLERNINKIIEKRESRIRHEFDVNDRNKKTKRTLILLQLREKDMLSLMGLNERDFEQNGNRIVRNEREFTRIKDGRNIRIPEMRGLRNINEISNIRGTRNKLITREVEFQDSDETQNDRRTERIIRIARHRVSINNGDLQDTRSEKQRDLNRDLEYIIYVRNYNGLKKRAQRENNYNVRTSDNDNNRGRDAQDRARDAQDRARDAQDRARDAQDRARAAQDRARDAQDRARDAQDRARDAQDRARDAQDRARDIRSSTVSRITETRRTNAEEREKRITFSKIRYLPIEHKTQSVNGIFEIQLEYIFYMLQGLYILGLFTKFTINSDGIQKRTRFSNWFPLFSTLKVH